MINSFLFEHIRGALYGVAVGDALGAPVEFMDADMIRRTYGLVTEMDGGGHGHYAPGETTDDTAMTLCVAAGIIENPDDPLETVGKHFLNWMASKPKDIGRTCSLALDEFKRIHAISKANVKDIWFRAAANTDGVSNGMSGGNGALMRTVYPALFYTDDVKAISTAVDVGRMTHQAEESSEAIRIYVQIVREMLRGHLLCNVLDHYTECTRYAKVHRKPEMPEPTGYVVDSLKCAIWALLKCKSFETSIITAVNMGGDTDTIGAITGGIAGAYYGYSAIPDRWINALSFDNKLMMDMLSNLAVKGQCQ